jgi:hypothetical protein
MFTCKKKKTKLKKPKNNWNIDFQKLKNLGLLVI